MARLPVSTEGLVAAFGPHLNFPPAEGFVGRDEPDRVVATHCCFCGMQCGIKLIVKDNRVIGFDPWEEFPFNEGRLFPKGVQRYLQNNHSDRLLRPLQRKDGVGFEPLSWEEAFERTVAESLRNCLSLCGVAPKAPRHGATLSALGNCCFRANSSPL